MDILTIEHWIDHRSTAPAIAGQPIRLYLREKVRADRQTGPEAAAAQRKVVLMIHGGYWPCSLAFDFPHEDYSWMDALARAGWDVFALDLTGYGKSTKPLMDDPRNLDPKQQGLLPAGLLGASAPVPATHPVQLVTIDSECDDIDRAVDTIRALRGVARIALIGWSGGGCRTGNYTYRHPEKVERLVIYASSNYSRDSTSAPPAQLPAPGFPMTLQTRASMDAERWRPAITCDHQVAEGMQDFAWNLCMETDPIGAAWGGLRGPTRTYWGWNAAAAGKLTLPVLIMIGENDRLLPSNRHLFADLGASPKAMIEIACASHFAQWEIQRRVLQRASLEWLDSTTVEGRPSGQFRADAQGKVAPMT